MIRTASCRSCLTSQDFQFVVQVLARSPEQGVSLTELLTDEHALEAILDSDGLYDSLVDAHGVLQVSPALYFYVTMRRALMRAGIEDRELCDYIATVLSRFGDPGRLRLILAREGFREQSAYLSDMMQTLEKSCGHKAFTVQVHIGDYALFFSGLFAEKIAASRRYHGGPDVSFYEQMGQSYYHLASLNQEAQACKLEAVLENLSRRFHDVRVVLNDLTERVFHLSEPVGLYGSLNKAGV